MFSRLIRQASRRAPRLMAKQATKALKATTKATRAAVRQGNKAVQQTSKAVRATRKTVKALEAQPVHRPPGRFVEVDGVRLHYVEQGAGAPLVLLHGLGSMIEDFRLSGLIDQAAQRYRVIAFDRPGYGYSTRPRNARWGPIAQASLVRKALQTLNVERPVVLGHSWGCLVASAFALEFPEAARGLVLASGLHFPTLRPARKSGNTAHQSAG